MRVIDFFDQGVAKAPDAVCLKDEQGGLRYAEVQSDTFSISNALSERGITSEKKIAVYSPNDAQAFVGILSIFRLGAVWVPINSGNAVAENCRFMDKVDVEVLLIHSRYFSAISEIRKHCPKISLVIGIDAEPGGDCETLDRIKAAGSRHASTPASEDPDALVTIYATGGSTGDPKAVMFTNRMWEAVILTFEETLTPKLNPVHLLVAPMTHGAGAIAMCLMSQGAMHIMHPGFDASSVLEAIEIYEVSHLMLPPTAIYALLSHPEIKKKNFSSLQSFLYGSAPMSVEKLRQALTIFGPVMVQTFGQTESPLICTVLNQQDHVDALEHHPERIKSCGKATGRIRLEIMDKDGAILGVGEKGEIVVKGALTTPGYYKNPQATEQLYRDDWLRTGDVGYKDEQGFLYIVDRIKDMIISGGFNIFPVEIEQVLYAHPAIDNCSVIGVPDDKWGETIKAVVKLKEGATVSEEELIAFCKKELGSIKAPKSIEFWDELPLSSVGKVLRSAIRNKYWKNAERQI